MLKKEKETEALSEPELLHEILNSLKQIEKKLPGNSKNEFDFIDNAELLKLLHISARTAIDWREKGTLKYSKVHGKIYYSISDLKQMLRDRINKRLEE